MDVRISGHHVDTGAAFWTHVRERLDGIVTKHFPRALSAHVTLADAPQDGAPYFSLILVHRRGDAWRLGESDV